VKSVDDRIDITWCCGDVPYRIIDPELVSYKRFKRVTVDGRKRLNEVEPLQYTVASCRPATEDEIKIWREQP